MNPDELIGLGDYEGWVAYVGGRPETMPDGHGGHMSVWRGGHPIFEAVPAQPELASTVPGVEGRETRRPDNRTIEWDELPHASVHTIELYYARHVWRDQPVVRLDKPESAGEGWRWIQQKEGAVVAPAFRGAEFEGQRRTGVTGWKIGCFNPRSQHGPHAIRFTVRAAEADIQREDLPGHPCWPTHRGGWGLAPHVLGLEPSDVPDATVGEALQ